jgi:uncharacterized cupredoxin-like copper-binding protein
MRQLLAVLVFVSGLLSVGCAVKSSEQNATIGTQAKVLGATQGAKKQEVEAKALRDRIDGDLAAQKENARKENEAGTNTGTN